MPQKKCKEKSLNAEIKDTHKYVCKKCCLGAKKESKLCKPKAIKEKPIAESQ